jgi:hypothetical protein
MNKQSSYLLTVILIGSLCFVVVSCANDNSLVTSPSVDSTPTDHLLPEFPMAQGTTWVYSYVPYEPHPSDPTQVVTATYLMTETVLGMEVALPYLFVSVQRDISLVSSTPLTQTNLPGGEFWYVISSTMVFEEGQAPDPVAFNPDYSHLAYEFPLIVGKNWCPIRLDLKNPNHPEAVHCEANGMRTVVERGAYQTPAGSFTDCYKVTEAYTSGGVVRWFCNGVGIVAAKYDHGGTRFGFEQTLVNYTLSSP